ncbi:methyl-accepting chemotaxis protein [Falsiroseomonas selenitidurans]|uniref:HAMP domain-containing protein n=1 Tax=Falsiroseomonas selenitidurans TaxID=2716335 RepID=A0ABX1E1S8_9PROT|nr:HAMP domain-containing methyl-accepting chemotaxis protein [Falsiroseomonas selenitidurans]NKC31038.1 HAMP domain-containing protein [Falsiroseomonas selenitidurans]
MSRFANLSIKVLLGGVLGLSLLMLAGFSTDLVWRAWTRHADAARVVQLAEASRMLFGTAATLRLERGEVLTALAAAAPDPDSARVMGPRAQAERYFAQVPASLRALGHAGEAQALETEREAIQALRGQVDAAMRLPRDRRDQGLAANWARVTAGHVDALLRVTELVEDGALLSNPLVDQLVALRRAGWTLRSGLGDVMLNSLVAVNAGRPWSPAEVAATLRQQGRATTAWATLEAGAARPGIPATLRAALGAAQPGVTGPAGQARDAVVASLAEGRPPAIDATAFRDQQVPFVPLLSAIPLAALDGMVEVALAEQAAARRGLALGAGLIGLALLLSLGGWVAAQRLVVRPIGQMTAAMRRLAARELDIAVPMLGRRNEIGAMAGAVQVFKDGLIEADRLGALQREEQGARIRRAEALDQLTRAFETRIGELTTQLTRSATTLESSASTMSGTAERGTAQAAAMARAAEGANGGVQSVAAAAEQLTASIREISRQISQSQSVVQSAVVDAERTDRVVRDLSEGAGRISEVVVLIRRIAAQTNLLALNATIEAARAGDAGKGFAVVAGEVKALAAQTAQATEDIGRQIGQIQAATEQAVTAIAGIAGTVGQVSEITTAIAAAVEQQSAATQGISSHVQDVAQGTGQVTDSLGAVSTLAEETGRTAQEVLAASATLARQAQAADAEVAQFLARVKAA